jgi:hypothetical protein
MVSGQGGEKKAVESGDLASQTRRPCDNLVVVIEPIPAGFTPLGPT